jgi:hypothetical protein
MPNCLSTETSPYLLQHAENPVAWRPWGPEALQSARQRDCPIFLSIGYSACHWCHVMARESFEDPRIAELLNAYFVPVKVDREERPELDQLYMEAVQMMTGQGGWPLSVFLTPELEPFFGGTYWPPQARGQMPGFDEVLLAVHDAWEHRRHEVQGQAGELGRLLRDDGRPRAGSGRPLNARPLEAAASHLARAFDPRYGGFGPAPKFPRPIDLRFLLRRWRRTAERRWLDMVTLTLDRMATGGIYDHLGGGFHRYSTDAQWLVPHFEKMLYDNALLAGAYLEAWQATRNPEYARIVRHTLDYLLREMTDPAGGFYASEDADSEHQEGVYYLWTPGEIRSVLGRKAGDDFCYVFDVTDPGNFENQNILHRPKTLAQSAALLARDPAELDEELAQGCRRLREVRARRARPARDEKVLVNWNALAIESLARAGAALGEPRYHESASRAADFLLAALRDGRGRLRHAWCGGRAGAPGGYLDDYAALVGALVALYQARFEERWIGEAVGLADQLIGQFYDPEQGGFFYTPADHEPLPARKKDLIDSAVPSGGGLAVLALLRLGKLCGRDSYLAAARASLEAAAGVLEQSPTAAGQLLLALDEYWGPTAELVILGSAAENATRELLSECHRRYLPQAIVAFRDPARVSEAGSPELAALFAGKQPLPPGPTLFVCEQLTCWAPVSGKEAALAALDNLATAAPPGRQRPPIASPAAQ